MKRIYFCGSISAGRTDAALYARIINILQNYGKVLTEHVGFENPDGAAERPKATDGGKSEAFIFDRDMAWLREADAIVAEVTQVSTGVGVELGWALALEKPTLCLYRPIDATRPLSAMVRGAAGPNFTVFDYAEPEATTIFDKFFHDLSA